MTELQRPRPPAPPKPAAAAPRMQPAPSRAAAAPPRLSVWQRAEAALASLHWFGFEPRCAQCGLQLGVDKSGLRKRCYVDPNMWAARCKELGVGVTAPFACPHLTKAAQLRLPARA